MIDEILARVAEIERLAQAAIDAGDDGGYSLHVSDARAEDYFNACTPEVILRRCAADRRILARHVKTGCRGLHGDTPHKPECFDCWRDNDEWPCADLRDLGDGYGIRHAVNAS